MHNTAMKAAAGMLGAAVVVVGLLVAFAGPSETESRHVSVIEASFAFDPADERLLADFASNVFVGRVHGNRGTKKHGATGNVPYLKTDYAVTVLENLKGELSGDVMVNQQGGYDEDSNTEYRVEGDAPLRPGRVYLFVTKYVPEQAAYSIVAPRFGDLPADDDAQREKVKEKFRKAIQDAGS